MGWKKHPNFSYKVRRFNAGILDTQFILIAFPPISELLYSGVLSLFC